MDFKASLKIVLLQNLVLEHKHVGYTLGVALKTQDI